MLSILFPFWFSGDNEVVSEAERVNSWPGLRYAGLGAGTSVGQCDIRGTSHLVSETEHTGDIIIPRGETYIIENKMFNLTGKFNVDGGSLIVRNSTMVSSYHTNVYTGSLHQDSVYNGGCVELTTTKYLLPELIVGCSPCLSDTPDNSTVFVNGSTGVGDFDISGSNDTVKIVDTIWGGTLRFQGNYMTSSRFDISNSLIMSIELSFDSRSQGADISGLHPGHFETWDLRSSLSLPTNPYDLALSNVTVIPNTVGPGPAGISLGWLITLHQNEPYSPYPCSWPGITIANSELTDLGFRFPYNSCPDKQPIIFTGLPSNASLGLTFFDSIHLVNSIVNGALSVFTRNMNTTFINVAALQLYTSGRSDISFTNATLIDGGAYGCKCAFTFANSRWGTARPATAEQIPYHARLPLEYSQYAVSSGGGGLFNSNITMNGDLALHTFGLAWGNSTADRFYKVTVSDPTGVEVANAKVSMSGPAGTTRRLWTTDREGQVVIPILFNDGNWTERLVLTASANNLTSTRNIWFQTDTPITLALSPSSHVPSLSLSTVLAAGIGLATVATVVVATVVVGRRRRTTVSNRSSPDLSHPL